MTNRLVAEFVEKLNGHPVTVITGPISPLLIQLNWSRNPEIPISSLMINKGRETLLAVDEYYYHLCGEEKFRQYIQKKVSKKTLEEEYDIFPSTIHSIYNEVIGSSLSALSEKDLLGLLNKIIKAFEGVAETVYIETLNYEMAASVLGEKGKSDLDKVWEQATQPTFASFEIRRLSHLVNLVKNNDIDTELVKKVKYIYTDYSWTKSEEEIKDILTTIKATLAEKEKELSVARMILEEKKNLYREWELSLTEEEKFLAVYIQMILLLRDVRKDPMAQIESCLVEVVTELLNRAEIDAKYGSSIIMHECLKGVDYLKSIKTEIIKRVDGNISAYYLGVEPKIEICDYAQTVKELYALTTVSSHHTDTFIKGQVANKGKVVGRVRVVHDPREHTDFVQGDILVTSMTRPEFVPLMKMAGGVVTNEGGITCHAAIVSRELGIPCVIGTRVATRFLKDGDLVEVDAEKGIVTILK